MGWRELRWVGVLLVVVGCASSPRVLPSGGAPPTNAWLQIDVPAFESNLRTAKALVGPAARICVIMKADAYGHGIVLLAPAVVAQGIPCVGITSNDEAKAVREAGFSGQLVRIRSATVDEVEDGLRYDLEEMIGNLELAKRLASLVGARGRTLRYHFALNAGGMSRNGIELATTEGRAQALALLKLPALRLVGIMTHFPVEEAKDVRRVLATFKQEAAWLVAAGGLDRSRITLHCANSFAMLEVPEARLDMVRTGGALYGDTVPAHTEYLRVLEFRSRVAAVNRYRAGNTVSYDRTLLLRRDSVLANIPVGYSDGYPRSLSNRGVVLIGGRRRPVVGRVTMNTIMVDVTDHPEVAPGDEVVLFGKQGTAEITQPELEKASGTIFAELYTVWGYSNPRVRKP